MMDRLETEITQLMADEGVILLDLHSNLRNGRVTVQVTGDREESGFTIDDCARLTREIRELILERKLIGREFTVEVGSPGLDYPLRDPWQFKKNIDRLLKVRISGERGPREISGRLSSIDDNGIRLTVNKKELEIRFEELLSAKVLPEFKSPRTESKR